MVVESHTVAAVCDRRQSDGEAPTGADTAPLQSKSVRRVKPLLYVYRVLLTGIHLMRTGELEANLITLNNEFLSIAKLNNCLENQVEAE